MTTIDRRLAEIARRIDAADVARRMVERFRGEIAGYQRLPELSVDAEVSEIARENVELFNRTVVDGRPVTDADLEPFRESAKRRATAGVPLEDLLQAYRLGARVAWQVILESARPDEEELLLQGVGLLMEYVDRVSAAVAQTYLDERQHLVSEEERDLRELLEALAGSTQLDVSLRDVAERYGIAVRERYVPFAQTAQGVSARDHSEFAARLRSQGVLAVTEGDRVTGLSPEGVEVPRARHPRALVALGDPGPRGALSEALGEVRMLLDIGCRRGRTGEIRVETYLPELLLARSPRLADRLRDRVIGPLRRYDRERSADLVETLQAFLASGLDRRAAAEQLHVHPNTLNYRLRRIEELTGIQLGEPNDLMLVALAMRERDVD